MPNEISEEVRIVQCRVGITTDPSTRKITWQNEVVGFQNWQILKICKDRNEAQKYENYYATRYGCQASPGGADALGRWYVYYFNYIKE